MAQNEYDVIVIGAGGAGSNAATTAASMGKRIALIERDKLGGTCLNYGCDPTKTLLHTAHMLYHARHASALGLRIPHADADWRAVQAHVRQVQKTIRGGTPEQARAGITAQGIDLFMGEATFTSPHEIRVNGETLRGERFVIATGTVPFIPDIEGLAEAGYITNVEAVSLPELPKRLVVIGGGPIGLEFAQMFSRFGVQVVVLERGKQPLPREDPELAMALCSQLTAEGIRLEFGAEMRCGEMSERGKHIHVHGEGGKDEDLVADQLLVAVGRRPALGKLNLEAAGVQYTEEGITTDATLRTNVAAHLGRRRHYQPLSIHPRRVRSRQTGRAQRVCPEAASVRRPRHPLGDIHRSRTRPGRLVGGGLAGGKDRVPRGTRRFQQTRSRDRQRSDLRQRKTPGGCGWQNTRRAYPRRERGRTDCTRGLRDAFWPDG